MASLMDTLVDRRANKNAGLMPFSAPTYAQVRCFFGSIVRAMYRLEVIGADRLPVTGPMVIAPNHDLVLDGLGAIRIKRSQGDQLALARMRQVLDAGQAVAIFPQGAVCGDRVWHRGAARLALVTRGRATCAGPPRRHSTSPLAGQNRLPAVAHHLRRADQSRAGAGRIGCGDEADRAVTRRGRIAGLVGFSTLGPKGSAKEGIRCL